MRRLSGGFFRAVLPAVALAALAVEPGWAQGYTLSAIAGANAEGGTGPCFEGIGPVGDGGPAASGSVALCLRQPAGRKAA